MPGHVPLMLEGCTGDGSRFFNQRFQPFHGRRVDRDAVDEQVGLPPLARHCLRQGEQGFFLHRVLYLQGVTVLFEGIQPLGHTQREHKEQ